MPQCLQNIRREILPPHSYDERLSTPAISLKASGFTLPPSWAVLEQVEQLHIEPALVSTITSNRTAPQMAAAGVLLRVVCGGRFFVVGHGKTVADLEDRIDPR